VEEQAEFPGGTAAMYKYIQQNVQYPAMAREAGISGKCFLKFVVNETGEISNVEVLKGVPGCSECDREAIRVVKSMPKWKAAKMTGKSVKCFFNLPINFKIQ
jgi:protein TonB